MGDVVIDATGDLDVAASAGAPFIDGAFIVTTVFRLGGVDTEEAERFAARGAGGLRGARPRGQAHHGRLVGPLVAEDAAARRRLVQLPAHGRLDGLKVEDLTRADFEGRKRIYALVDFVREKMPGFENCFVVDVAPQLGVRQTRLLEGEYVVTKEDVTDARPLRRHGRARPRLLHAVSLAAAARRSRACWSPAGTTRRPTPAQNMSREIPPCMAMGEAAGVAAALALCRRIALRRRRRRARSAAPAARAGRRSGRPARRQCQRPDGARRMTARPANCRSPASGSSTSPR